MQILERRLDNVVFHAGFAFSRDNARQIVNHGWVYVNNHRVNITSYLVKSGDVVELKGKAKVKEHVRQTVKLTVDRGRPPWLEIDNENVITKVIRLPEKEDLQIPIEEQMIVELYSK